MLTPGFLHFKPQGVRCFERKRRFCRPRKASATCLVFLEIYRRREKVKEVERRKKETQQLVDIWRAWTGFLCSRYVFFLLLLSCLSFAIIDFGAKKLEKNKTDTNTGKDTRGEMDQRHMLPFSLPMKRRKRKRKRSSSCLCNRRLLFSRLRGRVWEWCHEEFYLDY